MRSSSADYLEAAKLEALIADLVRQGYRVTRDARLGDQVVDLLAERDGERVAFEIKARSRLAGSTQEVRRLREAARDAHLTEFRLVVVNPPHGVDVTIENLHEELLRCFAETATPEVISALSSIAHVEDVTDVDVDRVDVRPSRIHVRGRANADVALDYGEGSGRDGLSASESFPFSFDLVLGPDLRIVQMNHLSFDTMVLSV